VRRTARRARRALGPVAAFLAAVACADATASAPPEGDATRPVGRWAARTLDGRPLPAQVDAGTEPGGWSWTLHVVSDSLVVDADGGCVARLRLEERNTKGEVYRHAIADRGRWTRDGDALAFVSTYVVHVRFAGRLTPDGALEVERNVLRDDDAPPTRIVLRR